MKLTEALTQSGISAIVYGESGMGKTHFLGTLPGKTLIIAAEVDGIKCLAKSPNAENIEIWHLPKKESEMNAFFDKLMIEDLPYDNICLDSATELDKYLMLEKTDLNKNDGVPSQKTYLIVQYAMRRYLRILRDIASTKNKNIIITALEQALELNVNGEDTQSKAYPNISTKKFPPEACGLFDMVAHIEIHTDGRRIFRLQPSDKIVAKDRIYGRAGCFATGEILFSGKTGKEETTTNTKEK